MLPSDGLHPRAESGCAHCGGDQRESGEGSGGRTFPAGPVSPPEGVCHQDTAAAGVPGGHTAAGGVFRELANEELGRHTEGFDKEAEKELMRRMWAGNVRELKQMVRSAVLLTEGRLIGADRLEAESTAQAGSSLLLKDGNEERERIVRALAQADGNREMTAGLLGISRTTLYNKMKEYGIMQKKSEK